MSFHNVRNAVAHSSFNPVPPFDRVEDGKKVHYGAGIEFSYIDPKGKLKVPTTKQLRNRKQKKSKQPSDHPIDEAIITYFEFDEYDAQLRKIMQTLVEIGETITPINEGINFTRDVAKIVASSDNIIPFVKPPKRDW